MLSETTKENNLILVVDDDPLILESVSIMLELNNFRVITAKNGERAIEKLLKLESPPDIILSDICMPGMDGYQFFMNVMKNPQWSQIPFIFLTGLSSPKEIRFAKSMGVDDYITKPFKENDLLAIIIGKLTRKSRSLQVENTIKINHLNFEREITLNIKNQMDVILIFYIWDDADGPLLDKSYPEDLPNKSKIEKLGAHLFHSSRLIYGENPINEAEDLLLRMNSIQKDCFIYFDYIPDAQTRAKKKEYMIALIAPTITYYHTFEIQKLFKELSAEIKNKSNIKLKRYWDNCMVILSTSKWSE